MFYEKAKLGSLYGLIKECTYMKIICDYFEKYVKNIIGLGKYALDIGTGSANMALSLSEMGVRCITIEKSDNAFAKAKEIISNSSIEKKPLLLKMDASKMTFLDHTFDFVVVYKSMHHIKNAKLALDEIYRVCKPGGTIVIVEHTKSIQDALSFLNKNRGEKHPNCIDMDSILKELREKEGSFTVRDTEIGTICVFQKKGCINKSNIEEASSYIDLGVLGNKHYYFDSFSNELGLFRNDSKEKILIKKEVTDDRLARSLCLNLANMCNLNCKYCYADGGNYGQVETIMSSEVAQKGIDWFAAYNSSPHIILFGGEPLINKKVIEEIINHNGKSLTYSINTNATLLDEDMLSVLFKHNVKVSISIDGTCKTHNSQRVYKDGTPTYEHIVEKLHTLPESIMKQLWARVTITNKSSSIYDEIISLLNLGFKKIDMSFVSGNKQFSESLENLPKWIEDIDKLAALSIQKWLNNEAVVYPFVKVFQSVIYNRNTQQTCTAGREMLSLQPNESIVPCFKFNDYPLGTLNNGISQEKVFDFEQYKKTMRTLICGGCWAYNFCGGLCPKDLITVINIQESRCYLIQQLVRRSLLHFADSYINNSKKFSEQSLQNKMSKWLIEVKKGATR